MRRYLADSCLFQQTVDPSCERSIHAAPVGAPSLLEKLLTPGVVCSTSNVTCPMQLKFMSVTMVLLRIYFFDRIKKVWGQVYRFTIGGFSGGPVIIAYKKYSALYRSFHYHQFHYCQQCVSIIQTTSLNIVSKVPIAVYEKFEPLNSPVGFLNCGLTLIGSFPLNLYKCSSVGL